jgi:predicted CoA-binding protein
MVDWQGNLIDDRAGIDAILAGTRRIAVLGIKPDSLPHAPAYFVPAYMAEAGYAILPVPVYYPEVQEILGRSVFRRVQDVPAPIDLLCVFRRPGDIAQHVDDVLQARPAVVWLQSGIRNDEAAETFARAGIKVVQDRCLMIEHRSWLARGRSGRST